MSVVVFYLNHLLSSNVRMQENISHGTHGIWAVMRENLLQEGCSFYSPIRYSELPRYYRDSTTPDDVAMFQVAPMDSHGYFNFGPNASHLGAVCETSKKIIVEVNENMPQPPRRF